MKWTPKELRVYADFHRKYGGRAKTENSAYLYQDDKAKLAQLAEQLSQRPQGETPQQYEERLQLWVLLKQLSEAEEVIVTGDERPKH